MRFLAVTAIASVLGTVAPLQAQLSGCWAHWEAVGGPYPDLQRSLELREAASLHPLAVARAGRSLLRNCAALADTSNVSDSIRSGPELMILPAVGMLQVNSKYPRPKQDGLRWAGRGLSTTTVAGAAARWGPISAALSPVMAFQQNDSFDIEPVRVPGLSEYGSYYNAGEIDLPRRFGDDSFWWVHLGQTFVRVDAFRTAFGLSTENLRWGPARRNPLLMSGAGPGFPHAFIGTSDPVNIGVGRLEVEAVWGRLSESAYFDTIPDNDKRLFAGLVVAFSPGAAGLTLGFARSYVRYLKDLDLVDQIFGPYTGIRDNPQQEAEGDNQLLSVFFRWVLPKAGFEVYGEYAREDHWEDTRDLIMELDHSRGYTVGVERVFSRENSPHMLRIIGEATNLGMSQTWQSGRGGATFYVHNPVRQGYTHRGRLLGAPIGPGSDAQYVAADYLGPRTLAGLYVERVRYDNDAYYRHFADARGFSGHDAETTVGVRGGRVVSGVQLMGELAYSSRYNRDFAQLRSGVTQDKNISVSVGAAWVPAGGHNVR